MRKMNCVLNIIRKIIIAIANIIYKPDVEYGQICELYDVNHCLVRYNMLQYRKEKIKGIYLPKHTSIVIVRKIMRNIQAIIQDKKYHITRLRRNESICLYDNDELVNTTINNVILCNIVDDYNINITQNVRQQAFLPSAAQT